MEIVFKDVTIDNTKINISINKYSLIGVLNFNVFELFNKKIDSGEIHIGRMVINNNSDKKKLVKIKEYFYFCNNTLDSFCSLNIMEDINNKVNNVDGNRLYELFKVFELKKELLDKPYTLLSTSEKKKILLICAIMSDKKIIIMEDPSYYLDNKSKNNLVRELKRLKRDKIIIINTQDTEFMMNICDEIIVVDKNRKVINGNKYDVLTNEKLLNSLYLKVPNILNFINKAYQMKKIKLIYRDNLNDTVKDVYRHVR